jgi:hypothetical protein
MGGVGHIPVKKGLSRISGCSQNLLVEKSAPKPTFRHFSGFLFLEAQIRELLGDIDWYLTIGMTARQFAGRYDYRVVFKK